jgi:hypothetical protein
MSTPPGPPFVLYIVCRKKRASTRAADLLNRFRSFGGLIELVLHRKAVIDFDGGPKNEFFCRPSFFTN